MVFKSKIAARRPLLGQSREIISNVIEYFKAEKVQFIYERAAGATGVSASTARRIEKEKQLIDLGQSNSFSSPRKHINAVKYVSDIDDVQKGMLKKIILNIYAQDKKVPSLQQVLLKFSKETGYKGCKESLRRIIRNIGFRWRRTKTSRKMLIENHKIRLSRINFLHSIKCYRNEDCPIIYMDEICISPSELKNSKKDDSQQKEHKGVTKDLRVTVVCAGTAAGPIKNSLLIFEPGAKIGDYGNYMKWFEETLIPNLPEQAVLVVNNAPFHNEQIDKAPTSAATKESMKEWLMKKNIAFDSDDLKPVLYDLIKKNEETLKKFTINEIMAKYNHNILRLPAYHWDLNPMESVWTALKTYVKRRNSKNIEELKKMCTDFFANYSREDWKKICDDRIASEDAICTLEGNIDEAMDEITESVGINSDTSTSDESDDDD